MIYLLKDLAVLAEKDFGASKSSSRETPLDEVWFSGKVLELLDCTAVER